MSQNKEQHSKDISRKDALKKMGSYAAFTALGTMMMLNPQKAQALSAPSWTWVVGFLTVVVLGVQEEIEIKNNISKTTNQ